MGGPKCLRGIFLLGDKGHDIWSFELLGHLVCIEGRNDNKSYKYFETETVTHLFLQKNIKASIPNLEKD